MKVLVVGAGAAGLAAGRALASAGVAVEVLERGASTGGRAAQVEIDGFRFDVGAEFFTSFYSRTRSLVEELGLAREVVEIRGSGALFHRGRLLPMVTGPISALTTPLLSWRTKIRLGKLAGRVLSGRLDFSEPSTLAPEDDESAEAYSRRTFGDEFTEIGLKPGLESLTLSPIGRTSKALFLAQAQEGPTARFYCLRGGMGRLCDALAGALAIRLRAAVARVRPGSDSVEVELETGERLLADGAVVAAPAPEAARMLAGGLPEDLARHLARAEYASSVKLDLGFPRPVGIEIPGVIPVGDGFEGVAGIQILERKGTGQVPEGAGAIGVVARGSLAEELLEAGDDEIERRLAEPAERVFGPLPGAVCRLVSRLREAVPLFPPGRYRELVELGPAARRVELAGDYLASPSVDGAIRSGERAARALILRLG